MRVNRSNTNPVLLEKLKTNGVEPGFIFRNDWSKDDTHGFMADIRSPASRDALDRLKEKNPCPNALISTLPVILEKSGLKRKVSPSLAPGRVIERIPNTISMTNNRGIRILAYFSMPF